MKEPIITSFIPIIPKIVNDIVDVAFNNFEKTLKKSYDKLIDIQYGIFRDGRLAINLKASYGWRDWLVDLFAFRHRIPGVGKYHAGFYKEIDIYLPQIKEDIMSTDKLFGAWMKGVIVSGRSKGGGEAFELARRLGNPNTTVGAVEPPHVCDRDYAVNYPYKAVYTVYKNDIVPSVPPWFITPAEKVMYGKRTHGLSIEDHIKSTTDETCFKGYTK